MKLLVGLGNPGKKYEGTRHNVGFDTLDLLAERLEAEKPRDKFDARVAECRLGGEKALLVWPQTFMNLSGRAAAAAVAFYKAPLEDVLVICDDFSLPLGKLRLRENGSAGGQNGLADVLQRLGTQEVPRLRIGVGPVPDSRDAVSFVLGRFAKNEQQDAALAVADAAAAVECWATEGPARAMNQFN